MKLFFLVCAHNHDTFYIRKKTIEYVNVLLLLFFANIRQCINSHQPPTVLHNIDRYTIYMQITQKNLQELQSFTSHLCLLLQFVLLFKMPFTISKEAATVHMELFSIKAFYMKQIWQISSLLNLHLSL